MYGYVSFIPACGSAAFASGDGKIFFFPMTQTHLKVKIEKIFLSLFLFFSPPSPSLPLLSLMPSISRIAPLPHPSVSQHPSKNGTGSQLVVS